MVKEPVIPKGWAVNLLSLLISFIFKEMREFFRDLGVAAVLICMSVMAVVAQPKTTSGKIVYRNSDGILISNNEFVDMRVANGHLPDRTLIKVLDDGTVEFRLQKVPQEGMMAPDFSVTTLKGERLRLGELLGKVVVLNFWFIGCSSCRAMKPSLNDFMTKFAENDQVVFIAMTADPPNAVRKYLRQEPFEYIQAAGAGDEMKRFVFSGYPKNIVISKTGEIVYWRSTIRAWDKFESVVRAELAK